MKTNKEKEEKAWSDVYFGGMVDLLEERSSHFNRQPIHPFIMFFHLRVLFHTIPTYTFIRV
jgi:hypothetical protein